MASTKLARRTLWAGILVGIAGLMGMLFTPQLLEPFYQDARIANGIYYSLAGVFSSLLAYTLPLSAALIGAFLIMRHGELRRGAAPTAVAVPDADGPD